MKKPHKQLLELFVSTDSEDRDWMKKPIPHGDKMVATTAHYLVAVPADSAAAVYPKFTGIYPQKHNKRKHIKHTDLLSAFGKFQRNTCDDCNGTSIVTFKYKNHIISGQCPMCIEGKTINEYEVVKIGKHGFRFPVLKMLAESMRIMKSKTATLICEPDEAKACIFRVVDVDILLMPVAGAANAFIVAEL